MQNASSLVRAVRTGSILFVVILVAFGGFFNVLDAQALTAEVSVGVNPTTAVSPTASPSANVLGVSPRTWAVIGAGLAALLAGWLLMRPTKVG